MAEIEIGRGKSGRRAYGFDDIAIVPSRRTRDPEDVDISWEIDAYHFDLPLMASAMDGVVNPATAIEIGQLGGVGVLNLEGVWTRYEDPDPLLEEIAHLDVDKATARMQQIYGEPIKAELISQRIREIKDAGVVCTPRRHCHRPSPAREIPRTSISRGRSTPTTSICRSWGRPWTEWSARLRLSRSASWAASVCSTWRACGPDTRIRTRSSRRSPIWTWTRPPPGCNRFTASRSRPS